MSLFPKFQVKRSPATIPAIPAIPAIRDGGVDRNSGNSGNSNAPIPTQQTPSVPCPTPDPAGNVPYRLCIAGRAHLVWLAPGLEPADVLQRVKALHPDVEVSDQPPAQGWPRLADIADVPQAGMPPPIEAWTPSGKRLAVPAYSAKHAAAIQRMNPPAQDATARQEGYEERAAIMQSAGGLTMKEAEQKAGTCYYCRHWCGTRSGKGWCVVHRPPVPRQAGDSCEQFTKEGRL